ncbi:MAG: TetR/AcrR family transcriptional regulator [Acidimicrobiia bacterium]|nr:TetR/AcrR family transcriptional regulator [Acidimicrobiia bacterium]
MTSRRSTREDTRTALLDAALEEFAHHGFRNTTHADIASAIGIGRTTFYEYFESTEDLLVQLVEERLPVVVADIVEAISNDLPPVERMRELGIRTVEFVGLDHLGLILHTESMRVSEDTQRRIALAHAGLVGAFAEVFEDGVAAGDFRDLPVNVAGQLMFQTVMGAGRSIMDSADPKQQVHETAEISIDFLIRGLAAG